VRVLTLVEDSIDLLIKRAHDKGLDLYIVATDFLTGSSSESGEGHFSNSGGHGLTTRTCHVFWPETLNTDESRLRQIIINIIQTSLTYTDQGFVRIYSEVNE
jgi:signal transduction histidine kinase